MILPCCHYLAVVVVAVGVDIAVISPAVAADAEFVVVAVVSSWYELVPPD